MIKLQESNTLWENGFTYLITAYMNSSTNATSVYESFNMVKACFSFLFFPPKLNLQLAGSISFYHSFFKFCIFWLTCILMLRYQISYIFKPLVLFIIHILSPVPLPNCNFNDQKTKMSCSSLQQSSSLDWINASRNSLRNRKIKKRNKI